MLSGPSVLGQMWAILRGRALQVSHRIHASWHMRRGSTPGKKGTGKPSGHSKGEVYQHAMHSSCERTRMHAHTSKDSFVACDARVACGMWYASTHAVYRACRYSARLFKVARFLLKAMRRFYWPFWLLCFASLFGRSIPTRTRQPRLWPRMLFLKIASRICHPVFPLSRAFGMRARV